RGGADGKTHVRAWGEGLRGGLEQHVSELAGQPPGRCHRAAEEESCFDVVNVDSAREPRPGNRGASPAPSRRPAREPVTRLLTAQRSIRRRPRQPLPHREATKRAKLSKEPSQPSRSDS